MGRPPRGSAHRGARALIDDAAQIHRGEPWVDIMTLEVPQAGNGQQHDLPAFNAG